MWKRGCGRTLHFRPEALTGSESVRTLVVGLSILSAGEATARDQNEEENDEKIVNLVLACILMLFVNTFALASEMNPEQQPGKVFVAEHSGIEIDIPGEYEKIKGAIEFTDLGDHFTRGAEIVEIYGMYYPMPEEEFLKLRDEEAKAENAGGCR